MVKPDQSAVSAENHGKVRRLLDAIACFLDRIAPPFTEPEAIEAAVDAVRGTR